MLLVPVRLSESVTFGLEYTFLGPDKSVRFETVSDRGGELLVFLFITVHGGRASVLDGRPALQVS